jgi:hypothetical protein
MALRTAHITARNWMTPFGDRPSEQPWTVRRDRSSKIRLTHKSHLQIALMSTSPKVLANPMARASRMTLQPYSQAASDSWPRHEPIPKYPSSYCHIARPWNARFHHENFHDEDFLFLIIAFVRLPCFSSISRWHAQSALTRVLA